MLFFARLEDGEKEFAHQSQSTIDIIEVGFGCLNLLQEESKAVDRDPLKVLRGPPTRQILQFFSDTVDLFVLRDRESGDRCAATWAKNDEAFCLQLAQSFTDWHRADAKRVGQIILAEAVARAQLAIEDHVPDSVNDGLLDIGVLNDGERRIGRCCHR